MSNATLEALANHEDIRAIRELILQDQNIPFVLDQLKNISTGLVAFMETQTPVLDLSQYSITEANKWIAQIQARRDQVTSFTLYLESYDEILEGLWIRATNMTMIQPVIEGLRSNEQRLAYINQLYEPLAEVRRASKVVRKKLDIISENIQNSFNSLQQQQRNLQLVAQVTKAYGLNVGDGR
jgi:hypothetical protein